MTDEDFEDLVPYRIIYHPDIVLDVVIDSGFSAGNSTRSSTSHSQSVSLASTTSTPISHGTTSIDTRYMEELGSSSPTSPTPGLYSDPITTAAPVDLVQACFQKLDQELDSNKAFRAEVGIELLHNRAFRAEMTDSVQQVNNRLAILQKRIESLITQTYELHEYPIPRLFIVLPKYSNRRRDHLSPRKTLIKQFRLYFLCECGEHTKTEGSKISHEIHLAKHEGYDLDRPSEFFQKYGSYVMTIMEMLKIGCAVAGIFVPAIGHLKLTEGINLLQKGLDFPHASAGTVVDDMIKYIQEQQNGADHDDPDKIKDEERHKLDRAEVLEGADLRMLESYLNIKDSGRALGNLYRMVTPEGHVKWVCMNHYRENYRSSVMQRLRDVVEVNKGTFSEEFGKIEIQLTSSTVAKQFYEAIVQARGVQELDVRLAWDVTLDELRSFASAVTMASIVNLTINGHSFKGPSLDFMNSNRRYDPIFTLMCNARIQSLQVDSCDSFYHRIGHPSVVASHALRVLHLDPLLVSKEKSSVHVFRKILDKSPLLTDLTVRCDDIAFALDLITKNYPNHKLEKLALKFNDSTVHLQFAQGMIQCVRSDLGSLDDLLEQAAFVKRGMLVILGVRYMSFGEIPNIKNVLEHNTNLSEIEIIGEPRMFNEIVQGVTRARNEVKLLGTTALRQLRLQTIVAGCASSLREKHSDKVTMTIEFCDDSVDVNSSAIVEMRSNLLTDLFEQQGSCIQNLSTNRTFDDRHAAALHRSTSRRCSIKSLKLDLTSLTAAGLDSVDTIIERSKNLENLVMEFQDLSDRKQQAKVVRSLILHGKLLYGLTLRGHQDALWLVEIGNALPNRSYLSNLRSLHVSCQAASIPDSCATWLAAMLQARPKPSSNSNGPTSPHLSIRRTTWTSLTEVRIESMVFSDENWATVIKAIDFSKLESLSFEHSNFGFDQLALLVGCIPDHDEVDLPLKLLNVKDAPLRYKAPRGHARREDKTIPVPPDMIKEKLAAFEEKAPLAQIKEH